MTRNLLSLILCTLCLALPTAAQEAAPKPPYERLLKGEDEKKAAELSAEMAKLADENDYHEAIKTGKKLLALRTKVQGAKHWETVGTAHNLTFMEKAAALSVEKRQGWRAAVQGAIQASELESKARYAEALPLQQTFLRWCLDVLGEDHPATATSYNSVAFILNAQGKAAEAHALFQKALEIRRRVLGEDHPATGTSYNNVAFILNAQGKAAEAQPFFQKALEIHRQVLGEDHRETATSYNNLGANLQAQGKAAEAQPLYQRALEINRRALGEVHPATATSYNNVALNLNAQGKAAEAQPLLQKALEIRRRVLGEDHPATATSYNNVALNLNAQGKAAEAHALFQKALEIHRRVLGEDHPNTASSYSNLAANLAAQGKTTEAQPLHQKALEIHRRVLGEDHPNTADSYNKVALNLNAQGKAAEARALFQKALEIRRQVLGENHSNTAQSYNNVAFNLDAQGKAPEAQPLYEKALEISRRVLGEDHPDTATSYINLACNLYAQGKETEAESLLKRGIFANEASRLTRATGIDRALLGEFNPRLLLAVIQQEREPLQAWGEVEHSLARGLLDQQVRGKQNLTSVEVADWTRYQAIVATLQPEILALVTNAQRTEEETTRLEKLLGERQEAQQRLAALAVSASTREVASGTTIQAALATDAALLYWVDVVTNSGDIQQHWGCVVRREGKPRWERLHGTGPDKSWTKEDDLLPTQFRVALADGGAQGEVEPLATKLHAQRLAPLLPHLTEVKTLYVVPVNEMAGVPVEVLTHDYTISYVPSGTFLANRAKQAPLQGESLLALGDPIFTTQDAQAAASSTALPPGGLLITLVAPEGTAGKARLQEGDVLVRYANVELDSVEKLTTAIQAQADAKEVELQVWREGEEQLLTRKVAPGKLGIAIAQEPALEAIANRRKMDAMLLALRGGDWNDLPGTRVEASRIGNLFGEQATVLADSSASEQKLDAIRRAGELKKYRYLHFATHGEGNNVRAFESALILAQDSLPKDPLPKAGEPFINGQLSASEVLEFWKLDAELVTLSACETAVGSHGGGDGALGFAQAFLTAGSRAVCLSLWKVDDTATTLLMDRFYQNLLGKRPGLDKPLGKAAALAEAKNWLRNLSSEEALQLTADMTKGVVRGKGQKALPLIAVPKPDDPSVEKTFKPFEHPKYWAAFILIGDPD